MCREVISAALKGALIATAFLVAGCGGGISLPAAIEPARAVDNPVRYTVAIEGDLEEPLRELLNATSELVALINQPPAGRVGLRQRTQQDLERLRRVLHAEGYYGADVTFEIRSVVKSAEAPTEVIVRVETGPVYLLEDYAIHYADRPSHGADVGELPREIEPLGLHTGMRARSASIVEAQKTLLEMLGNTGRPFALVVNRSIIVDHDRTTMQVAVDIDPGPFSRFGETRIEGNEGVDTAYLRKLLPWREGETFTQKQLELYRVRLAGTGLFERVQVSTAQQAVEDGDLPVLVNVHERTHRAVGVGLGYSTDQGPSADVFWEHRNIWGRQEWLRLSANTSINAQTFTTDVRKPHFPVLDQHLLFNATANREISRAFEERSLSTFAGVERKKWDIWALRGGPSLEYTNLYDYDTRERTNFALVGLPLSARRDSTDDLLDPRRGSRFGLLATPYYGTVSNSVSFLALEANGSASQAVDTAEKVVFAGRFRIGSVVGATTYTLPANTPRI